MCNGSVKKLESIKTTKQSQSTKRAIQTKNPQNVKTSFDNILVIPATASLNYTAINICDSRNRIYTTV